jgi:hypothetical protein
MATQTAAAKPKRTQRQDTPQPCPDPIAASLAQLQSLKLPTGDGDRMESDWHVVSISLLDELVRNHLGTPHNYFCGGNMFIYYSIAQAKEIEEYVEAETVQKKPRFKGPDFFLVKDVDGTKTARELGGVGGGRAVSRLGGGVYFQFHAQEGCGQECGVLRESVSCARVFLV